METNDEAAEPRKIDLDVGDVRVQRKLLQDRALILWRETERVHDREDDVKVLVLLFKDRTDRRLLEELFARLRKDDWWVERENNKKVSYLSSFQEGEEEGKGTNKRRKRVR
jgi:hypothetical protein